MEINVGLQLHGFTVTAVRDVPGKDAQLVEMLYEKTQTELVWYKSQESNKLFSIAFKTLPEDSTGVFHILEHSVLCGSDKYPVKEPFVELLKSSMNTFLNAMTFPDKTMYPVSSRNEQDFLNLTSVYLDAVFAPKILSNPNIFYQEGWHYEPDGDGLRYNGVVFNEMKGAMSGVDGVVEQAVQDLLFPDNCYGYNSGGDPRAIPDLTYEQFLDSYRKNYPPTNARVYLDGDIPVERTLALIESYLETFTLGSKQELTPQTPKAAELTVTYEAASEEDLADKAHFVLTRILGSWADKTGILAAKVLGDVLCGSNDAPLKRAVLSAGLGQDVTLDIMDGVYQPWMVLRVHNMQPGNAAALDALLAETAKNLAAQGLDKEALTASINRLAFQVKDMHEPQALIRCINAMDSWLYGGDPMLYLTYDEAIDQLRVLAQGDGFEVLLTKLLLEQEGLCRLHALPSLTHGKELTEQEQARLAAERNAMTEEEFAATVAKSEAFCAWQKLPDTPEGLATLPVLSLEEIGREPMVLPTEETSVNGVTLLRHRTNTNGIVHLNAYFNLSRLTLDELTDFDFAATLLGKLPTASQDAATLQQQIKTHLGSLRFSLTAQAKTGVLDTCTPYLLAQCSVLKENLPKAEALLAEILTSTDFTCHDRIREVLMQTEMEAQQYGMMAGHQLANSCAQAHFSAMNAVTEATSGYTYLQSLHDFSKNFDAKIQGFTALAQKVLAENAVRAGLTLSLTEDGCSDISGFIAKLPAGEAAPATAAYTSKLPKKLGIRIPAQVSYACIGYHIGACGAAYNGTARLLSNILSLSHLWNAVRVQGGAYGAGMRITVGGGMFSYSYRDPSPAKSLKTYRAMADFVKAFGDSGEELTKYIISSVAETEPLLAPMQLSIRADNQWFSGSTYEDAVAERKALLGATQADLASWCEVLERFAQDGAVCVVGTADALSTCTDEDLTVVDI